MKLVINILLLILFIILSIISTVYDHKKGIIPNKLLIIVGVMAILLKLFDYDNRYVMLIQLLMSLVCSVFFYWLHIWAGGDAKLFIVNSILVPNILYKQYSGLIFRVLIISYSIVYIFLILDSVYAFIDKRKAYKKINLSNINVRDFICNWLLIFLFSLIVQKLLIFIFKKNYVDNYIFFSFLNIFLVLAIRGHLIRLNILAKRIVLMLLAAICIICTVVVPTGYKMDIHNILLVVIIFVLREWANKYSYISIETSEIKKGMILSASSVLLFMNSSIKGLPMKTTEDMAARLNDQEVASIKRWLKTKNGKDRLIIVKKIPFASFINIGYAISMLIGGYKLWLSM